MNLLFPVLNNNYSLLKQHEHSILYPSTFGVEGQLGSGTYEYEKITKTAAEILMLSDGTRSIDEIARILSSQYSESFEVARNIVNSFLDECLNKGVVTFMMYPAKQNIDVHGDFDTIYPFVVQFELTKICPLKCLHCYNNSGTARTTELSTIEVFTVLNKIKKMGVKRILLTGGEPTSRADIADIIKYASKGLLAVVVVSNGYHFSERLIDEILKCGNVVVQISLDGTEKNHNYIRGVRDSYQKAIDSISLLVSKGIPVMVAFTFNEINIGDIDYVTTTTKKLGAKQITYGGTVSKGRAKENNLIQNDADGNISRQLKEMKNIHQKDGFYVHIEYEDVLGNNQFIHPISTCGKGDVQICVRENGDVSPCVPYNFVYGNLYNQEPEEIFHYSNVLKLRAYNAIDMSICKLCEEFMRCGGCEAVAFEIAESKCVWKQKNRTYLQGLQELTNGVKITNNKQS